MDNLLDSQSKPQTAVAGVRNTLQDDYEIRPGTSANAKDEFKPLATSDLSEGTSTKDYHK